LIISHKYKFIYIKSSKTAGTSLEVYLSQVCDKKDVFTPICPSSSKHVPRNHKGFFNPVCELSEFGVSDIRSITSDLVNRRKYYNHITARRLRCRLDNDTWSKYLKFTVERNPFDKVFSMYKMLNFRRNGKLSLAEFFDEGLFLRAKNYKYYADSEGNIIVDKILRYENLDDELNNLFSKLGIPFFGSLDENEKSSYSAIDGTYKEVFTEEQLAKIRISYSDEIALAENNFSLTIQE